jgi:hypothetical protein
MQNGFPLMQFVSMNAYTITPGLIQKVERSLNNIMYSSREHYLILWQTLF